MSGEPRSMSGGRRPAIETSAVATGKGDDGTTGLLYGGPRISKDDLRTEAYGTIDEAVAALGVARAALPDDADVRRAPALILRFQRELFVAGAELATTPEAWPRLEDGRTRVDESMLAGVEAVLADLEGRITHAHRVRRRWRDVGLGGSGAGADDPPARGAPGDRRCNARDSCRVPGCSHTSTAWRTSSGSWRASPSPSRRPMPGRPSRAADAGRGPATEDRAHVLRAPVAQDRTSDRGRRPSVVRGRPAPGAASAARARASATSRPSSLSDPGRSRPQPRPGPRRAAATLAAAKWRPRPRPSPSSPPATSPVVSRRMTRRRPRSPPHTPARSSSSVTTPTKMAAAATTRTATNRRGAACSTGPWPCPAITTTRPPTPRATSTISGPARDQTSVAGTPRRSAHGASSRSTRSAARSAAAERARRSTSGWPPS